EEPDPSVDDEQLAVGPVVDARQALPADRVIELDVAPGLDQGREILAGRQEAADRIEDHAHRHARGGPRGHRLQEAAGDLAALEDVGLQMDAVARLAYGLQLRLVEDLAVGEDLDLVARVQRAAGPRPPGAPEELRIEG